MYMQEIPFDLAHIDGTANLTDPIFFATVVIWAPILAAVTVFSLRLWRRWQMAAGIHWWRRLLLACFVIACYLFTELVQGWIYLSLYRFHSGRTLLGGLWFPVTPSWILGFCSALAVRLTDKRRSQLKA